MLLWTLGCWYLFKLVFSFYLNTYSGVELLLYGSSIFSFNEETPYYFPNLETVHCFMSGSNCCFLTFIWVSQETGKGVWYCHFLNNFPPFVLIYTFKGFSIVNEVEVDVFFWNPRAFAMIQWMLAIWSLVPLPFLNPACTYGSSQIMYCCQGFWA